MKRKEERSLKMRRGGETNIKRREERSQIMRRVSENL